MDTTYAESDGRLARLTARQRPLTASPTTDTYLQDDTYLHDPAGNPTSIVHNTTPTGTGWGDETECFAYDTRQRLTVALTLDGLAACPTNLAGTTATGPDPYHEIYTIDALTRITNFDGNTRSHGATTPGGCRTYTDPTKPHALVTSTGSGQSDTFTYDCNGALVTQVTTGGADPGTTTYQYDPQQRLVYVSTPDGATVNTYDTTNNRVLRVDPDGTRTVYLGTTEIRYTPSVGIQVARAYNAHARLGFDGTINYYTTNHQQSVTASLFSTGAVDVGIANIRYTPYGTLRTGTGINDRGFLDQPDDPTTPTVYLNNRHYNPTLGVFISVDPIAFGGSPVSLNPYTYSGANPITASDPSGLAMDRPMVDGTGSGLGHWNDCSNFHGEAYCERTGMASQTEVQAAWDAWSTANRAARGTLGRGADTRCDGWLCTAWQAAVGALPWIGDGLDVLNCISGDRVSCLAIPIPFVSGGFVRLARRVLPNRVSHAIDDLLDWGSSPATNTADDAARFVVDSAGNTTLRVQGSSGWLNVSPHAAERLTQRGISIEAVESTLRQPSFQYWQSGANAGWRTGFYDSGSRVFVTTANGEVVTVINNASQTYINNVIARMPP